MNNIQSMAMGITLSGVAAAKFILVFLAPHVRSLRPTYNAETSVVTFD